MSERIIYVSKMTFQKAPRRSWYKWIKEVGLTFSEAKLISKWSQEIGLFIYKQLKPLKGFKGPEQKFLDTVDEIIMKSLIKKYLPAEYDKAKVYLLEGNEDLFYRRLIRAFDKLDSMFSFQTREGFWVYAFFELEWYRYPEKLLYVVVQWNLHYPDGEPVEDSLLHDVSIDYYFDKHILGVTF